jgi:hypothetical protein
MMVTTTQQPEVSDTGERRSHKRRPRADLKLYQVWVQDLDWGDEVDDFNLVAATSAAAATRMVVRVRVVDEGDRLWFNERRKAGKWRVQCYGQVPTTARFVW